MEHKDRIRKNAKASVGTSNLGAFLRDKVIAAIRANLSVQHKFSAKLFLDLSKSLVRENTQKLNGDQHREYRAYAIGSVISSVCWLETTINDLYLSAVDGSFKPPKGMDPSLSRLLAGFWNVTEEAEKHISILEKYQVALQLANKAEFDKGTTPYQEVSDLLKLRNGLVHFKPEWDTDEKEHKKIQKRLESYRFELDPYYGSGDAFFPKKCLSHGCAEWAYHTADSFLQEFNSRMKFAKNS